MADNTQFYQALSGDLRFENGLTFDKANNAANHAADINRYLGGFGRTAESHPYIKGYFYVYWGLPQVLFKDDDQGGSADMNSRLAANYMLSGAEGYTPPGDRQLKYEDLQGMGGVDASFITGQTIDRSFSIQYRDYWGAPIFRAHRAWTQYLNPYYGGVAIQAKNPQAENTLAGTMFEAREYKGTCMVIQTKPITPGKSVVGYKFKHSDIIKVDFFDGVFPVTDLKSAYDSNITDNTVARPTVQYRYDGFPLDETNEQVLGQAYTLLNSMDYESHNASPAIYDYLVEKGSPEGIQQSNALTSPPAQASTNR